MTTPIACLSIGKKGSKRKALAEEESRREERDVWGRYDVTGELSTYWRRRKGKHTKYDRSSVVQSFGINNKIK